MNLRLRVRERERYLGVPSESVSKKIERVCVCLRHRDSG